MKEIKFFPILITGPYIKIESDRTRAVGWLRNTYKSIKIIYPDNLNMESIQNKKIKELMKKSAKKLSLISDQFEYVVSKIVIHHFNFPISSSAIFELGQFHNILSKTNTSVLIPVLFKNEEETKRNIFNEKYNIGDYIKSIYKGRNKILEYKAIIDINNHYIEKLDKIYPFAIKRGDDSLSNIMQKIMLHKKNNVVKLNPRIYIESNLNITYKWITYDYKNKIVRLPIKHLYINFVYWILTKNRFDNFIDSFRKGNHFYKIKEFEDYLLNKIKKIINCKSNNIILKILYSKTRLKNLGNLYDILIWIFIITNKQIIFKKMNRSDMAIMINQEYNSSNNNKYFKFKMKRKNKIRILTTYSKNIEGDLQKKLMIENKKIFNKYSSQSSFAYTIGKSYLDAIKIHIPSIKNKYRFIKIDIKDFFPSLKVAISKNEKISNIMLKKNIPIDELNQGTVLAPSISNAIMSDIDKKIENLLIEKYGTYSRYSDDILILLPNSSENEVISVFEKIKEELNINGFKINVAKSLTGDETKSFQYLSFIFQDGKIKIPNRKSKQLMKWVLNPKKYNLNYRYIKNYVNFLKDNSIFYRNDIVINNILDSV